MGAPTTEAIEASEKLLKFGIYANVIVITSSDLLLGNLAFDDDYLHLRKRLGVDGDLYMHPSKSNHLSAGETRTLSGRRIPIVSVHDGEPGLLDNIGSVIGVKQVALAVRKHSRCGRPKEIYRYHGIDADAIVSAVGKVLSETAIEKVQVSERALGNNSNANASQNWRDLWPQATRH